MKKQRNNPQEPKKENVSVLENIRRRTGLLVGIIGLALLLFMLESLLGFGTSIFGTDEYTTLGAINGNKIDRNEFVTRLESQLNNYRQRNQGREVDDQVRGQAIDNIFNQYIVNYVMMPQFEEAGIQVTDDELYHFVVVEPDEIVIQNISDPNTGQINPQVARPDGSLDPAKWRMAVQGATGESEASVKYIEDQVKNARYFNKFRVLINKSLYVTKAEAARDFRHKNTTADVAFVMKRFDAIPDSAVKVSDSDIEKYYKEHSYEFKSPENTRRIEYVVFDVLPTEADMKVIEQDAIRAANEFKGKSPAEDSVFMMQESENGNIVIQRFTREKMIIRDTAVFTAAPGTVFGPYNEGAYFKIYKLQDVETVADSARVRHILVATADPQSRQQKRTLEQAKKEADSVLVLLRENKANFDSLVVNFSDDPGSKTNGGDYGWYDESEGFVDPFKYAGLKGVKGNISVVQTEYGYHIIEVLDVSKTSHRSYKLAQVFKPIEASEETQQRIFGEASRFAGENNTGELFDKSTEKQNLTKRLAENVREGDYHIPGLENPKDIVKWAFNAEKGEVSIFSMPDKHVVAKLSGIRNKGILPLEEVEKEVTVRALEQKKAEMLLEQFNSKTAGAKSIEEVAKSLGEQVYRHDAFRFDSPNVVGAGHDLILAGTIAGMKPGVLSKPVASHNGVFVAAVSNMKETAPPADLTAQKREMESVLTSASDYSSFNALKEVADIRFHRSRLD